MIFSMVTAMSAASAVIRYAELLHSRSLIHPNCQAGRHICLYSFGSMNKVQKEWETTHCLYIRGLWPVMFAAAHHRAFSVSRAVGIFSATHACRPESLAFRVFLPESHRE